jgi:hypothetical protein
MKPIRTPTKLALSLSFFNVVVLIFQCHCPDFPCKNKKKDLGVGGLHKNKKVEVDINVVFTKIQKIRLIAKSL